MALGLESGAEHISCIPPPVASTLCLPPSYMGLVSESASRKACSSLSTLPLTHSLPSLCYSRSVKERSLRKQLTLLVIPTKHHFIDAFSVSLFSLSLSTFFLGTGFPRCWGDIKYLDAMEVRGIWQLEDNFQCCIQRNTYVITGGDFVL